jgi:hypothetical protein
MGDLPGGPVAVRIAPVLTCPLFHPLGPECVILGLDLDLGRDLKI